MGRIITSLAIFAIVFQLSYGQHLPSTDIVESFMDGTIKTLMAEDKINGVTIAIVNGDSVYWSKGYGYADSEKDVKIDPASTLFRIGSVSKLFVWTAVMQLYEEGLINLDADITTYIDDFTIPDDFEQPITMKHLLSHTPGFEDYYFALFSTDSLPPPSLGDELKKHMPARIRPPGIHASYSNHGTSIAAYIVEEVSGLKWDDYVEKNIFIPLGMTHSSFRYVLPDSLKALHSKGYSFERGSYKSHPFKGIPLAPAGLACSSAEEMGKFMLAHLNNGEYNGYQLLDSSTVALMHSDLFTHDDLLRGFCYGFFNLSRNGYRIIGHGGATEYFFSYLKILPEDGYGIFISTNTQGGVNLIGEATDQFIDQFFPDTLEYPSKVVLSDEILERYSGAYLPNRRPMKRITRLAALTNSAVEVTHAGGNIITSQENAWFPIDSNTFQSTTSTSRLSFGADEEGNYNYLFFDSSPHTVSERVSILESRSFNIFILALSAGIGLLAMVWWMASYIFKRNYNLKQKHNLPTISKWLVIVNSVLIIVFLILMTITIGSTDFVFRPRITSDYLLFTIPMIIGIITISVLYLSGVHFVRRIKWRSRIFYLLIALGMGAMTYMMYFWNLIGYKF